jgi:hypothetical protein
MVASRERGVRAGSVLSSCLFPACLRHMFTIYILWRARGQILKSSTIPIAATGLPQPLWKYTISGLTLDRP